MSRGGDIAEKKSLQTTGVQNMILQIKSLAKALIRLHRKVRRQDKARGAIGFVLIGAPFFHQGKKGEEANSRK